MMSNKSKAIDAAVGVIRAHMKSRSYDYNKFVARYEDCGTCVNQGNKKKIAKCRACRFTMISSNHERKEDE